MDHSLTEGNVLKKLLFFALPILGANLLQALYGTVDLMIVGLFTQASEVSAVSTGSMTMQTITGIVIGLTMGCTVLLGNSIGMEDYKKASRAIASSGVLFVGGRNCINVFNRITCFSYIKCDECTTRSF